MDPFIALTDKRWFDYLSIQAIDGVVDEVNFWQPKGTKPMRRMEPGTPVFFRLKKPHHALVGYGFFAHFQVVPVEEAWNLFGWRNGDGSMASFLTRISSYRNEDLSLSANRRKPIGCTVLRDARFWPEARWVSWREEQGWKRNIVQGRTETDTTRKQFLMESIANEHAVIPRDLGQNFIPVDIDQRTLIEREVLVRQGQGTFRLRLLDAYGRCAITGEHTQPVLDAAHIQPYLGPASNHVQNGLLLTKEFHALFDRGYVTVTPDYQVKVSDALHDEWNNGARYYAFQGNSILLPDSPEARPCRNVLAWHQNEVYRG